MCQGSRAKRCPELQSPPSWHERYSLESTKTMLRIHLIKLCHWRYCQWILLKIKPIYLLDLQHKGPDWRKFLNAFLNQGIYVVTGWKIIIRNWDDWASWRNRLRLRWTDWELNQPIQTKYENEVIRVLKTRQNRRLNIKLNIGCREHRSEYLISFERYEGNERS